MAFYHLTPVHDLEVITTHDGNIFYRSTSHVSYFDVILSSPVEKGWHRISIPIECLKGSIEEAKLHFSWGEKYNESHTIQLPEVEDDKIIAIVAFDNSIKSMRFDPTIFKSEFVIDKMTITKLSQAGAAIRLFFMLRKNTGDHFISFLFKTLQNKGLTGIRKEFRDAGYVNADLNEKEEYLSYEEWLENQIKTSKTTYNKWKAENTVLRDDPLISIVLPTYNTPLEWLEECISSVMNQTYENWELCIADDASTKPETKALLKQYSENDKRIKLLFRKANGHISACTNSAIGLATGEWIAFIDHDDTLTENALFEIVQLLRDRKDADVIYTDQDKINVAGKYYQPFFKPDWSPVFFRGVMYAGHLLVVRRSVGAQAGWFNPAFDKLQDYEFMLRVSEITSKIVHLPKVLYHWRESERSIAADSNAKGGIGPLQELAVNSHLKRMDVKGYATQNKFPHRISLLPDKREQHPKISIIIPTKNHTTLLKQCVDSILLKTTYPNYEIIIMDTGSDEIATIEQINTYSKNPKIKILYFKEAFNFSKVNNIGAHNADGSYYVFMNNDTQVITEEWLENLIFYADSPGIGAVGPLLIFPNGTVQHAGVVLGFRGTTDHVMRNYAADGDGYFGSLSCAREVSAVTAACIMVKKEIFNEVGGFEENYNALYQDIDLCLKIRKGGYTIIYTPTVKLYHMESVTRGEDYDFMDRMLLKDRWKKALMNDPYYNPNFTLKAYGKRHTGYEPKYRKNK